jgi:hypothetical protein
MMTRDEAIADFNEAANPSSFSTGAWIDRFVALGMLKLDEPKNPSELAILALDGQMVGGPMHGMLCTYRLGRSEAIQLADALDRAGLKIVEK